ncbi:MAG TPA: acylphosphatase [Candidatus Paceibacterota bacterium]|nr:acylphosphatase [Candidatus Paceibacterota bacterium]
MVRKLLKVRVFGKVKGVFFRHSAKIKADSLSLNGFARNEDGDCVYIEAEGSEGRLKEFMEWCREGPPLAKVGRIEAFWAEPSGEFSEFEIK